MDYYLASDQTQDNVKNNGKNGMFILYFKDENTNDIENEIIIFDPVEKIYIITHRR